MLFISICVGVALYISLGRLFPNWSFMVLALISVMGTLFFFVVTFIPQIRRAREFTSYLLIFQTDATKDQIDGVYRRVSTPPAGYQVYRDHRLTVVDGQKAMVLEIFNTESPRAQEVKMEHLRKMPGVLKVGRSAGGSEAI